ncbi:MAG: superoxide dismutase [Breznakibacter sp.]
MTLSSQNPASKPVPAQFPELPYAYNALEPHIDAATMELHYSKHFKGYYDKFVTAVKGTPLEKESLKTIFSQISKSDVAVRNNGGGYYNHMLFWANMSPSPISMPDALKKSIEAQFGSVDNFKAELDKASLGVFGSGWAWLIMDETGKLRITTTPNQDNPLMDVASVKGTPLLAIDVWEHAYYLKYQNKRQAYIDAFWNVINWQEVSNRFAEAKK